MYADHGTGCNTDFSVFGHRGGLPSGCYVLGEYAVKGYRAPSYGRYYCSKKSGVFARPVKFTKGWDDSGTGGDRDGSLWLPICPRGYVALGGVAIQMSNGRTLTPSQKPYYRCLNQKYAKPMGQWDVGRNPWWTDSGSGGDHDARVWKFGKSNFHMAAEMGHYKPQQRLWDIDNKWTD